MAQTDNSYLADKVQLRIKHLPAKRTFYLLDCFAGQGTIWKNVVALTGARIHRLPIDFKKDIGFHLPGGNMAYLSVLDLNAFDVIDLDAYGVPYLQLRELFDRNYRGLVFVTFIQSVFGAMPIQLLEDLGISRDMVQKCPTLFWASGWTYFKDWLARHGVRRIHHRFHGNKHYFCFNGAERGASRSDNPPARRAKGPS